MTFCVISSREVRIFISKGGAEFELTPALNNIIAPFDEARIKDSFAQERWNNEGGRLDSPAIRKKARDLLALIIKNTRIEYDSVSVAISTFKNLSDLRAGKITILDRLDEKVN